MKEMIRKLEKSSFWEAIKICSLTNILAVVGSDGLLCKDKLFGTLVSD